SIQFQPGEIAEYFLRKRPKIGRKEDILSYLDRVGDANLLQQKGRNVFEMATASFADVRKWAGQLMDEGVVESVWTPQGIHWALKDQVPNYVAVYAQRSRLKPPEEKVLALLKEKPRTHKELLRATKREKDALNESLRKLEGSYLVASSGRTTPARSSTRPSSKPSSWRSSSVRSRPSTISSIPSSRPAWSSTSGTTRPGSTTASGCGAGPPGTSSKGAS